MTTDIEQRGPAGALEPTTIADYRPLDIYSIGRSKEPPRLEAIATISAGRKVKAAKDGRELWVPRASRKEDKEQIHLHDPNGHAPALKARLEASGYRSLCIAFPWDSPAEFTVDRFAWYTATALRAYGDETAVTEIKLSSDGKSAQHVTYSAGSEDYERIVRQCKANHFVYFMLAHWEDGQPRIDLAADELGLYRLRFTSRNSINSVLATLAWVARLTRGRIAGIPFQLSVSYREVADPMGAKREIPVWKLAFKPPEGLSLSTRNFRTVVAQALDEGAQLILPAPEPYTIEHAALEAGTFVEDDEAAPHEILEPSEHDLDVLRKGGRCDREFYTGSWFAAVQNTPYQTDEGRAEFLRGYTGGDLDSLACFLAQATDAEAAALLAAVRSAVKELREDDSEWVQRRDAKAREAGDIWGTDETADTVEETAQDEAMPNPWERVAEDDEAEPEPATGPRPLSVELAERLAALTYGDTDGYEAVETAIVAAVREKALSEAERDAIRVEAASTRKRIGYGKEAPGSSA